MGKVQKLSISRFIAALLSIAACFMQLSSAALADSPSNKPDHEVKIGVLVPLTGPFARYGKKIQESIAAFGNDQVAFVFEDEGCDPKMAVTAYKKLAEVDEINLFLGPWCGSPQSAVAPQLKTGDRLAVLGSSAPEAVFSLSGGRMFSTQHSIEAESAFLAQKLNQFGVASVAIIFRENAFSRAHEAAFRSHFEGKIFDTLAYSSDDVADLKSIALKVKLFNPDAIFVPDAFPLMAGLLKELSTIGVKDLPVYSVYSVQSEDVLNVVGAAGEGLVYSYPDIGTEEALHYFPTLAAKILVAAVSKCGAAVSCVKEELLSRNAFDDHGVLAGKLSLRTIRGGKFVPFTER